MDYELMMNSNVKIGQNAPNFDANTTMGKLSLDTYKEKWKVLFSYTGDFTPVSTTEIIAFAKVNLYFQKINTSLIGLSVDSNYSHLAWLYDIYCKTGIKIPFPIIADRNAEIARKYGMISSNISNIETVRNVFIIDNNNIIKTILVYPINIGRNVLEILRIVRALQISEETNNIIPANWNPYEPTIKPMPNSFLELQNRLKEKHNKQISWYLAFNKLEKKEKNENKKINK